MDIFAIVSLIFSGVVLLLCAWLVLSKQKISLKVIELNDKLVAMEARNLASKAQNSAVPEKKMAVVKAQISESAATIHAAELLELRKEVSKLKDEVKKAKEELRFKDKELKGQEESIQNKLYTLTEENSRLIEQMREMDQKLKLTLENSKKQVPLQEYENKQAEFILLKDELVKTKQKSSELDKSLKQSFSKLSNSIDKLKSLENEIQKWQEAAKTLDGKSLDSNSFLRWHDRALAGRKMYRLMRQMRELSDSKVVTYQDGVVALAKWVLEQKNLTLPPISQDEIQADRLLAEAWNAILPIESKEQYSTASLSSSVN